MQGTEMIIALNTNNNITVTDYYSYGYQKPTDQTSTSTIVLYQMVNSSGMFVTFTRDLKPSSKQSIPILIGLQTNMSYAYLTPYNQGLQIHSNKGYGLVVLGASQNTSNYTNGAGIHKKYFDLNYYEDHGIYMTVMWVGIIQLAIMTIRYFKWWSYSGFLHSILGTVVMGFTWVSAYKTYKEDLTPFSGLKENDDFLYHSRIAFTMCSLTMSQFSLGLYFKYIQLGTKKVQIARFLRIVHKLLGWSLPIMALVNIRYGWILHGTRYKLDYVDPAYYVLIGLIALLEIRHRWGNTLNAYLLQYRMTRMNSEQLEAFSASSQRFSMLIEGGEKRHYELLEDIRKFEREWVFFDEFVLDVSGFKWNHPGGKWVFKDIYGEDVGKYINGCANANNETNPYYHSENARNMINFLKIGRVAFPRHVLINVMNAETESSMVWTLTDNTMVSSVTHCLEFSSFNWKLNPDPPGYEWMGKHFLVTNNVKGTKISRYYSLVIVNLAEWAEQLKDEGFSCNSYLMQKQSDKLRLHIKEYPEGKMSSSLCSLKLGSSVHFKGPLGPGLNIQNFLDRQYLIFGAGTGILPFLDIAYCIWNGKISKACFYMHVSFRNDAESFALDLLNATAKRFPKNLVLTVKIGQAGFLQESEFWKNMMPLQNIERAWICGPPVYNRKIKRLLIQEGFLSQRIVLL